MPVDKKLKDIAAEQEKGGAEPTQILDLISQSASYKDVGNKISSLRKSGSMNDEQIYKFLKTAKVEEPNLITRTGQAVSALGDKATQAKDWMINNIPVAKNIRPILQTGGAMAGGVLAAPANLFVPGFSEAAGVGSGALAGSKLADFIESIAGVKNQSVANNLKQTVTKDIPEAAITGMMGPILGGTGGPVQGALTKPTAEVKGVIPWTTEKLGNVIKPLWGRLTGTGTGSIEEAIKSGMASGETQFDKALKGKITGEEVVGNAKDALNVIKNQRSDDYTKILDTLPNQTIDKTPIAQKLVNVAKKFGYQIAEDGKVDTQYTASAIGSAGDRDIKKIIGTVMNWGKKDEDLTPRGLDTLKRNLDDYYSDSSNARAFVSEMRKAVHDTISDQVPQYKEMTQGYAEATNLVKDIESGLMMRKQGISGRVVADQTLRRLVSTMKDNFELRRDLVNTLGSKSGADLSGQIAGYTMRSPIPVGLAGTGPAIAAEVALAKYVDPHFWPMIAASSPRVAAEFLKVFGKAMSETQMARPVLSPAISNVAAKTILAPTAAAPAPVPQEPAPKTRSSRKYGKKGNEDDLNAL